MSMLPSNLQDMTQLELEVIVSEEEKSIYVKFMGFENVEEADDYATFLQENLPLLLFESEIKH